MEKKKTDDYFVVKVNIDVHYMIKKGIDGRTEKQIIEEWFKNHPMSQYHASRDICKIGGSEVIKNIKIITLKEREEEIEKEEEKKKKKLINKSLNSRRTTRLSH